MSKSRKKVFPKPPVRFHSGLEKQLGRNSNKVGYEASLKAIYYTTHDTICELSDRQSKQLEALKRTLSRR